MLNTVSIIPTYVRVLHLELISGLDLPLTLLFYVVLKFVTSVLICLCLQNR